MNVKIASFVFALTLGAANLYAYDWSQHAAGDVVTLTETAEVTDNDLAIVTQLGGIVLEGEETDIVFKNAEAATLSGYILGAGKIVKEGAGDLTFGTPHAFKLVDGCSGWAGSFTDYYTTNGIVVKTGSLWFPQAGGKACAYGPVTVEAGATLHVQPDSANKLHALNGAGTVTNGKTWTWLKNASEGTNLSLGYYGDTHRSEFSGTFVGNFDFSFLGDVTVSSTNSLSAGGISVYRNDYNSSENHGVYRTPMFGMRPAYSLRDVTGDDARFAPYASPVGVGHAYFYGVDYDLNYSGKIFYTGTGETTDKIFRFGGTYNMAYCCIDAGPTGGVTFSGEIRSYGSDKYYGAMFRGSNTNDMVITGKMEGGEGRMHFMKEGTGTWAINAKDAKSVASAWFVRNGTLKYSSIANIGEDCVLGTATNCWKTDSYANLPAFWEDETHRLACEIVLGDWIKGTVPTFEYTGAAAAQTDRRIGIAGSGARLANNGTGSVAFSGSVTPMTGHEIEVNSKDAVASLRTLYLAGSSTGRNAVSALRENATGTLRVVKEDAGTWEIKKDFAISGDIDVKAGKLTVHPSGALPYSWFRFSITGISKKGADSSSNQYIWLKQLAFFDANGARIDLGGGKMSFVGPDSTVYSPMHTCAEGGYDWTALQPGQVTFGDYSGKISMSTFPSNLFLDDTSYFRTSRASLMYDSTPSTWLPIVFRLPVGTPAVKYYDVVNHCNHDGGDHVSAWKLEGSEDGVTWVELDHHTTCNQRTNTQWDSTGVTVTNGIAQACIDGGTQIFGYAVTDGTEGVADVVNLAKPTAIAVSRGATFESLPAGGVTLPKLTVDCASGSGNAVVKGFVLSATGTLVLKNVPAGGDVTLPIDFTDCSGVANLADWTITLDGAPLKHRFEVRNGTLHIIRPGHLMIIR